ncbi:Iron hydrogenase [Pseudocohnilembus persalinus]|uniref:Iron hydrogenase n=1 Tax=Pseudocohnilembus persalinus TaxID=266149 RepID=A0A0V0QBR3_PSEPJ|nr:Iron hydrogenase [Pseudocohnilembus persalinus]|eukprot:KRW99492.1 Iron hydrogenase [Pseudocohnilembus persalinus]
MAFSTAVKIAQLDDYINPSQDCIIPIVNKDNKLDPYDMTYIYGQAQESNLILKNTKTQTAQISLSDCLACSGCVTTAESILKQEQSIEEFKEKISNMKKNGGISIIVFSNQALASLANHFKMGIQQMLYALKRFFHENLPDLFIIDSMEIAQFLALQMSALEFVEAYQQKKNMPILSSECPGWTCYAEKQSTEQTIDIMSKVKSPQQIIGSILKKQYNYKLFMTTLMPCYDKKVESARKEFETNNVKDVDMVLTCTEIMELVKEFEAPKLQQQEQKEKKDVNQIFPYNDDLTNIDQEILEADQKYKNTIDFSQITGFQVNSLKKNYALKADFTSNGYLDYVLNYAAKNMLKLENYDIERKQMKNSDFIEYNLYKNKEDKSEKLLSFAKVYGLKNIQNLLRNIKIKKCKYSYIEIMACPQGCVNGGGQMKSLDENIKSKDFSQQVSSVLNDYIWEKQEHDVKIMREGEKEKIDSFVEKLYKQSQVQYKHIDKSQTVQAYQW